jgi:hypothetical protein
MDNYENPLLKSNSPYKMQGLQKTTLNILKNTQLAHLCRILITIETDDLDAQFETLGILQTPRKPIGKTYTPSGLK